jgi:tRNA nucleotidyltransferase (CCA-adding enzyme)
VTQLTQPRLRPSEVVVQLQPFPEASLWAWALAGLTPAIRRRIRLYLTKWRYVKPSLDGSALLRLGVPKGALVGEAMRMLQAARLDGRVRTREQEVAAVRRLLRERGGSS